MLKCIRGEQILVGVVESGDGLYGIFSIGCILLMGL